MSNPEFELLQDNFELDKSLTDIFVDKVCEKYEISPDQLEGIPISVFAAAPTDNLLVISDNWYSLENSLFVKPETYHSAIDFGFTSNQIIEGASRHYNKLRDLGMSVIGHAFETVDEQDDRISMNPVYPTIISATKISVGNEEKDNDISALLGVDIDTPNVRRYSIEEQGMTEADCDSNRMQFMKQIISPLTDYHAWCEAAEEKIMLTNVHSLRDYFYHSPSEAFVLGTISSRMQITEITSWDYMKRKLFLISQLALHA